MAIRYQSRSADATESREGSPHYGDARDKLLDISTKVLAHARSDDSERQVSGLKADEQVRQRPLWRACRKVVSVPALTDLMQIGPMDFFAHGIEKRRAVGLAVLTTRLKENNDLLDADLQLTIIGRRPAARDRTDYRRPGLTLSGADEKAGRTA